MRSATLTVVGMLLIKEPGGRAAATSAARRRSRPDPEAGHGEAICRPKPGLSTGRCIINGMTRCVMQGPLTYELSLKDSPIRQFFDDRLIPGLKEAQAVYCGGAGPMLIPGVARQDADAGTIGTAADWLTRFLVHPTRPR